MGRPKGSKNGTHRTIDYICETCCRTFQAEPWRQNPRFCSVPCKNVGHAKEMTKPVSIIDRQCAWCWRTFQVDSRDDRLCCSKECTHADHGRKVTGHRRGTKTFLPTCPVCKCEFETLFEDQVYCSRDCVAIARNYQPAVTIKCQNCHTLFQVGAAHKDSRYCTRRCALQGSPKFQSRPEQLLGEALELAEVELISQYKVERYHIDHAVPNIKLAIEADGDYWHDYSEFPWREEIDQHRDGRLQELGWTILHFSESSINSNLDDCIRQVLESITYLQKA